MSEEDTFNKLRKLPFWKMLELYQAKPTHDGAELRKFLNFCGWTVSDFYDEWKRKPGRD